MIRSIVFCLFFVCLSLQAEVEEARKDRHIITHLKKTGDTKQARWTLKVLDKDGYDHIDVYLGRSKKPILSNTAELIGHRFNKAQIIKFKKKAYLVTRWNSGAHGEEVLIFDLNLKKPKAIWFYVSSWPATLQVNDKELIINGTGDMNDDTGLPDKEVKKWNPSTKPMDFSLDQEASQSSK